MVLPIFERLFLGGEYSIRGFDIRSIGPRDPVTQLVLGGNKSLLFNAEYLITIAGPVRLVLFYDAGQVRDLGEAFAWKENVISIDPAAGSAPVGDSILDAPDAAEGLPQPTRGGHRRDLARSRRRPAPRSASSCRYSNVPFRLIFAHNGSRVGVLDNNFQPAKRFTFRFAVGTTF